MSIFHVWSEDEKEENARSYNATCPTEAAERDAFRYIQTMKDGGEIQMHVRTSAGFLYGILVTMDMVPQLTGTINKY